MSLRKAATVVLALTFVASTAPLAMARNHCEDRIRKAEEKLHRDERKHGEHSRQAEKDRRALEDARAHCDVHHH